MKRRKTQKPHIVCIIDMSGSMSGTQSEIVGSFNHFLDEQKAERGDAYLTLVFFDDRYDVIYDRIDIQEAEHIDRSMYQPRGMTALYDAVGRAIKDATDDAGFVLIQTDGLENSSNKYTRAQIQKLIKDKEEEGWDFMFLGADINAKSVGDTIGLGDKSVQFNKTAHGIETAYSAMSGATSMYRASLDTQKLTPQDKGVQVGN